MSQDPSYASDLRAQKPQEAPEGRGPVSQHPANRTSVRGQAGPAERGSGRCRWAPNELRQRAEVIAAHWAAMSGHDVRLADAERIARLNLPLAAVSKVLREVWRRRTGLGLAWPLLREAEADYKNYLANRPDGGTS